MRLAFAFLASLMIAGATAAADPPVPAPSPSPSPAERAATRPLSLDLDKLFDLQRARGHAEFDSSLRQVWWNDPMVRLSLSLIHI